MLALRLPRDIEKRLDDLARRTGRTKSYYAREAILRHLEDMEDLAIAEQRVRDGEAEWLTLDEARAELGLAGDHAGEP